MKVLEQIKRNYKDFGYVSVLEHKRQWVFASNSEMRTDMVSKKFRKNLIFFKFDNVLGDFNEGDIEIVATIPAMELAGKFKVGDKFKLRKWDPNAYKVIHEVCSFDVNAKTGEVAIMDDKQDPYSLTEIEPYYEEELKEYSPRNIIMEKELEFIESFAEHHTLTRSLVAQFVEFQEDIKKLKSI